MSFINIKTHHYNLLLLLNSLRDLIITPHNNWTLFINVSDSEASLFTPIILVNIGVKHGFIFKYNKVSYNKILIRPLMSSLPSQIHNLNIHLGSCTSTTYGSYSQHQSRIVHPSVNNSHVHLCSQYIYMYDCTKCTLNAALYALGTSRYIGSDWKMFSISLTSILPYRKRAKSL